jgi:hypothetical protein
LISRIYKEFLQINKKNDMPNRKLEKDETLPAQKAAKMATKMKR